MTDDAEALTPQKFEFTQEKRREIQRLAALGMSPLDIAVGADIPREFIRLFETLADTPGSEIHTLIAQGEVAGRASAQIRMQEIAAAGNVEAARVISKMQADNLFKQLIKNMDDDEFSF